MDREIRDNNYEMEVHTDDEQNVPIFPEPLFNGSKTQAIRRRIGFENLRIIISATLFVGVLVAAVGAGCGSKAVLLTGFLLEAAAIVIMLIFWRCPHCGRLQGRLFDVGEYCTYCGKRLDGTQDETEQED